MPVTLPTTMAHATAMYADICQDPSKCTNPISDVVSKETAGWTEDYCCGDCYICGLWHDSFDVYGDYGIV